MTKTVYICHCIDTEGPLYESLSANFERLKEIFGIELPATEENLYKIQNKELNFGDLTDTIADVFSKKRISTLGSWDEIDKVLNIILDDTFRKELLDSRGKGWIYSWFCMHHAGFSGENPRKRDSGYNKIYDHYVKILSKYKCNDDIIGFHFHPIPFKGHYNLYATSYVSNSAIFEILAHAIIDRHYFPAVYRPGFNTERPDSHWFLEQWIPFDFGNQSLKLYNNDQPDISNGRFGNWTNAPLDWYPYHPDYNDYQKQGDCKRWITRCLNIDARIGKITEEDVNDAFICAQEHGTSLLAFTNHDFRDMQPELMYIKSLIRNVSAKYPDVKYVFCNALDAMRKTLNIEPADINITCEFSGNNKSMLLHIIADSDIFGSQPYFSIKTNDGKYYWDNLDYGNKNEWYYAFDPNTFLINEIDKIGIAANNATGKTAICVIDCNNKSFLDEKHNSVMIN